MSNNTLNKILGTLLVLLLIAVVVLVIDMRDGNNNQSAKVTTTTTEKENEKEEDATSKGTVEKILNSIGKKASVNTILKRFKKDGLEVGEVSDLANKEFGNIRKEGKRVLIPSLGEDAGGRLFEFENEKDLEKAKSYYDELSNGAPMFYSHTHQSGLFLLQMNGEMSDEDFEEYTNSMNSAVK